MTKRSLYSVGFAYLLMGGVWTLMDSIVIAGLLAGAGVVLIYVTWRSEQ